MDTTVVLGQMCIIFVFIIIGYLTKKKRMISDAGIKDMTWLIVNVCNPALILSAVMNQEDRPSMSSALVMVMISVAAYAIMILIGLIMGRLLRAPKKDWKCYNLMTVFGNTGFIGMPLAQAVLGSRSVLYLAIFALFFNLLIYTYGIAVIRRGEDASKTSFKLRSLINPGTVTSVIALLIFFTGTGVPGIVSTAFKYLSNPVTFLAVFVIGATLADMDLASVFNDPHIYLFTVLRQIVFPIVFIFFLKMLVHDSLVTASSAIAISVPVGNMPLMLARFYGEDTELLTKGIIFTTIFSVITITIVSLAV